MKTNILTWLVPFVLGAFLTFVILDMRKGSEPELQTTTASLTPVADKLNAYSCKVAETKEIILGGEEDGFSLTGIEINTCLLYTSPSPRDQRGSRMPSSA